MIGYKAFTRSTDGKLWTFGESLTSKVNYKEYSIYSQSGKIRICLNGIHYCPNVKDLTGYCRSNKNTVIYKIEDIGDERTSDEDKTATNKIALLEEIDKEDYPFKLDERGNVVEILVGEKNVYTFQYKYNANGVMMEKKKYINGILKEEYEYNNKGDNTLRRTFGCLCLKKKWEYYKDKKIEIRTNKNGQHKFISAYDNKNGKVLYMISPSYKIIIYKYNKFGDIVKAKYGTDREEIYEYKYDKAGNKLYCKDPDRVEHFYNYDSKGRMVRYRNTYFNKTNIEWKYNKCGDIIYKKDSNGDIWEKII